MACSEDQWLVYMLQCADGSLYTGITNQLQRRIEQHCAGKGARYTRGRGPLLLVYQEYCSNKSAALKRELAIKALPRTQKLLLAASQPNLSVQGNPPCAV